MNKKRNKTKKMPDDAVTSAGDEVVGNSQSVTNYTANDNKNQEENEKNSEKPSEKQLALRGRHFSFIVYEDSAPDNWRELLQQTGLPFAVSPLHDKDVNADGSLKKEHYHGIVSYSNTTTYRAVYTLLTGLLHCPLPQLLHSVTGMYRYFNHKDNPDKYQYSGLPEIYNGWERPLDNVEIDRILEMLEETVYLTGCVEYAELLCEAKQIGPDYHSVARNNAFFLKSVCSSYRNNPYRVLSRYYNSLTDTESDKRAVVEQELIKISGGERPDETGVKQDV